MHKKHLQQEQHLEEFELEEFEHPQPPTPMRAVNSTVDSIVNKQ